MNKINWKVRFKNPQFIFQIGLAVIIPILGYFGIEGTAITSWGVLASLLVEAIKNPYVVMLVVVSIYNAINDPTTTGITDSERAMRYIAPGKEDE